MEINVLNLVSIGFAITAAVLLVWFLVRRPPLTKATKIVLLFGMGILPIGTATTGNYAGFEATKERQFCGSCHVMTPYSDDSSDPNSKTLAAAHGRNPMFGHHNCYTCHADYGMFGTIKTKLGGLGHIYEYTLNGYHAMSLEEAREKIHLKAPYQNSNCMQCHSTRNPGWNAVKEHASLTDRVRSNAISCASEGCHGPAHPFSKTKKHEAVTP